MSGFSAQDVQFLAALFSERCKLEEPHGVRVRGRATARFLDRHTSAEENWRPPPVPKHRISSRHVMISMPLKTWCC